jgi:biopolymer transport protein ExbD
MKKSARQLRLERRHKAPHAGTLSLTSLMDIFTILLFFLLVSVSNTQKLPDSKFIVLPKSSAEELPKETLTIEVGREDLLVKGRLIASTQEILAQEDTLITRLKEELDYQAARSVPTLNEEGIPEREITILMDSKIPYEVLKKIMVTCTQTEYSKISFAVMQDRKKGAPQEGQSS